MIGSDSILSNSKTANLLDVWYDTLGAGSAYRKVSMYKDDKGMKESAHINIPSEIITRDPTNTSGPKLRAHSVSRPEYNIDTIGRD
jgi:hypothetical protein